MSSLIPILAVIAPFVLMWLMWRRMKRVNAQMAEQGRETRQAATPQEDAGGRGYDVNQDLVDQGARSRQNPWHIT